MNRLIVIAMIVAALAGSVQAQFCTAGPRGGIDYSAHTPAGVQPGGQPDDHKGDGVLQDTAALEPANGKITAIWGYAHCGWAGLTQEEADSHVDRVEFWLLEDTNGNGVSDEAATTPWRLVHSYAPGTDRPDYQPDQTEPDFQPIQQYHVTGWNIGDASTKQVPDGSGSAWEGQDVLQGEIAGLEIGKRYFLLTRVVCGDLTNTMPQDENGRVTGPEEFVPGQVAAGGNPAVPGSTNIRANGNGSAISDHEVVWFQATDQTHKPETGIGQ